MRCFRKRTASELGDRGVRELSVVGDASATSTDQRVSDAGIRAKWEATFGRVPLSTRNGPVPRASGGKGIRLLSVETPHNGSGNAHVPALRGRYRRISMHAFVRARQKRNEDCARHAGRKGRNCEQTVFAPE
jgi:hypothetical protein